MYLSLSISWDRTGAAENAGDLDELDGNPVRNMSVFRNSWWSSIPAAVQRNSLGRVHFGGSGLCGRCRDGRLAKGVVEVRVTVNRAGTRYTEL